MPSPRARTVVASSIFTWSCHNHHRPPRIATTFLTHRPLPPRSAASASFSTTHPSQYAIASRRDPTYYDVLNVPVTATPAEIKKSAGITSPHQSISQLLIGIPHVGKDPSTPSPSSTTPTATPPPQQQQPNASPKSQPHTTSYPTPRNALLTIVTMASSHPP